MDRGLSTALEFVSPINAFHAHDSVKPPCRSPILGYGSLNSCERDRLRVRQHIIAYKQSNQTDCGKPPFHRLGCNKNWVVPRAMSLNISDLTSDCGASLRAGQSRRGLWRLSQQLTPEQP